MKVDKKKPGTCSQNNTRKIYCLRSVLDENVQNKFNQEGTSEKLKEHNIF